MSCSWKAEKEITYFLRRYYWVKFLHGLKLPGRLYQFTLSLVVYANVHFTAPY